MIKIANTTFPVLIGFLFFSSQVYFVHLLSTEVRTFLLYIFSTVYQVSSYAVALDS